MDDSTSPANMSLKVVRDQGGLPRTASVEPLDTSTSGR
jgi:hypothetical protein